MRFTNINSLEIYDFVLMVDKSFLGVSTFMKKFPYRNVQRLELRSEDMGQWDFRKYLVSFSMVAMRVVKLVSVAGFSIDAKTFSKIIAFSRHVESLSFM